MQDPGETMIHDTRALMMAIDDLLTNEKLRGELGAKTYDRLINYFIAEKIAYEYLDYVRP